MFKKEGIIESVQYAEWAPSIVPILKSDSKSVRIYGVFKAMVNKPSKLTRSLPHSKDRRYTGSLQNLY